MNNVNANKYGGSPSFESQKALNKTSSKNINATTTASSSSATSNKRIPVDKNKNNTSQNKNQKKEEYIPPDNVNINNGYVNENEEVAIKPKGDFYAMLEM